MKIAKCKRCGLLVMHTPSPRPLLEGVIVDDKPVAHHGPCDRLCNGGPVPDVVKGVHSEEGCRYCKKLEKQQQREMAPAAFTM